jgi:hypothetical protein
MHTDIHASSGIQTHDPTVQAGDDSLCLRLHGHCDQPPGITRIMKRMGITWAGRVAHMQMKRCIQSLGRKTSTKETLIRHRHIGGMILTK